MGLWDWLLRGGDHADEDARVHRLHHNGNPRPEPDLEGTEPERPRVWAVPATELDLLWEKLDPSIKQRAIAILRRELGPEVLDDLAKRLLVRGPDWYISHHMGWGMAVRNLLRQHGIRDEELPPGTAGPEGNWDDYYGAAVNAAVKEHCEEPIRKEEEAERRAWEDLARP